MKSLVDLVVLLLQESGSRCGAPNVARDIKTLRTRVSHEGDSFLTITLPSFAKEFERALEIGRVAPEAFAGWTRWRPGNPAFLQGFLCRVFDKETGCLLPSPSIDCIRAVRQVCLFCKKLTRPCTRARERAAIDAYVQCEDEVLTQLPETQLGRYFGYVADIIVRSLAIEDSSFWDEIVPHHGPGATQDRLLGNQKWRFRKWHRRLTDGGFSFWKFGLPSLGSSFCHMWHSADKPAIVEPADEPPVRVVLVPKTLKTPRVIAVEPVCMQYAQQGLKDFLVGRLENRPYTRGHVNFVSQTTNRNLAVVGSLTGQLATLDMAEASDRVSMAHVERMFATVPQFRAAVMSCRSQRALLPDGREVDLKKFASMGSALCFPVEALAFYCAIVASRCSRAGKFPSTRTVLELTRSVFVYGDDLIVPADEAPEICEDLEALGFKVNTRKSFWNGKFRESCGKDVYDGSDVTPCYIRRDVPTGRRDSEGVVSTVSLANRLYSAGYVRTARALKGALETAAGKLPQVSVDSPAIGWHFYSEWVPPRRWNRKLQRWETAALLMTTSRHPDSIDGVPALAKSLRMVKGIPTFILDFTAQDPRHLTESTRRHGLALKRGWTPAL